MFYLKLYVLQILLHKTNWISIHFGMERKVQILSVKKNEIIIRTKNARRNFYILPLVFISFFVILFSSNNSMLLEFKDAVVKVCNPVSSLYNDNSKSIFTNGDLYEKDLINLYLPIKSAGYEILDDGTIEFTVGNSIMVMAPDSGKIEKTGTTLDGIKYIEMLHKNGIVTVISGIDIVGVNNGDMVKAGQDIATTKIGKKIKLKVMQNGNVVENLKVDKSKIVWEN